MLSQSISSVLWAFATLSIQDAALLECSAGQALQFLDSFSPQARLQMSLKPSVFIRYSVRTSDRQLANNAKAQQLSEIASCWRSQPVHPSASSVPAEHHVTQFIANLV